MYNFIKSGNNCNRIKFKEDFMRRDFRKNNQNSDLNEKIIKYAIIGVSILAVIVLGLLIYSKSLNDRVKDETLSS